MAVLRIFRIPHFAADRRIISTASTIETFIFRRFDGNASSAKHRTIVVAHWF